MTYSEKNSKQKSGQVQDNEEFVSYLKVLFTLIEGDSEVGKVRPKLIEFFRKYEVSHEIEAMLKDLFTTKFNQEI